MKKLFYLLLFFSGTADAQTYYNVTHLSGTAHIACTDVTVTSSGSVSSLGACATGPYRLSDPTIPPANGTYTWNFAPGASDVRIDIAAIDALEFVSIVVNGVHLDFTLAPPGTLSAHPDPCYPGVSLAVVDATTGDLTSVYHSNVTIDLHSTSTFIGGLINTVSVTAIEPSPPSGILASMSFVPSVTPIGLISGPTLVCSGSSITLIDASSGGTWTSGATGIATVAPTTGVVYGVSAGTAVISYTLGGGCVETYTVTVEDQTSPCSPCHIFTSPYITLSGGPLAPR